MANRWGNSGNSDRLYFFTLQNHCKWWLQPWNKKTLDPWKKSYDQPRQHITKLRHYFANKVHLVKAMVFPVFMYGCESWTIKKAEHRRIDVFELWYWRREGSGGWGHDRYHQMLEDPEKEKKSGLFLWGQKEDLQNDSIIMKKLNIQKTKIMASSPITSWKIDGETVETVSDFIFLGSKITADGDCSHEIKRRLLFGRKVMT